MARQRHPAWVRRVSATLVVPMVLLCTDFSKGAWAFRNERARRSKLIDVAKKQGLDPEILLDPIGYQKNEAERAKVRRAKAVKEAEELSKPDPVAFAAAEKERAQVRKAYAPVELASIAKDIEGLRTTFSQLHASVGNRKRTETALNTIDGYARILGDAHEVLARYDATERERLASLPPVIRARHDRFMREVQPLVKNRRDGLDDLVKTKSTRDSKALAFIEQKLAHFKPAPNRPIQKGFALHSAKFVSTTPRRDPEMIRRIAPRIQTPQEFDLMNKMLHSPPTGGVRGIFKVPSFLIALLSGPGSSDLAATDEAPLSGDIVAKANALNHDPIAIYNFVHDNVVTEVYYGSKKGARGTLAEMAGNDFDQASLLVALLRASGIPSRYEMGTVVLTLEQAMGFTGTETPAAAGSALVSSGFPAQQLATGNTVTGVEMELTWVRAYVSYQNYRGVGIAPAGQGSVWAHLAPSIKRYQSTANATNLVGAVPFDFEAYLSHEQPKSPVDTWEDQVRAYLQANPTLNCTTLDSAQKNRIPIADQLPLLPETLPMQVAQRLAVFSDVPSAFKHRVEIVATSSGGVAEIDYSASIAALYGRPLAVQFDPATAADATTLAAHGGLDHTPAYLVQLRPVLYSADVPLATGPVGDTPGVNQSWQLHFSVPNLAPEDPTAHTLSVGGVYALVLDAGTLPGAQVDAAAQLEQDMTSAGRPPEMIAAAHLLTLGRRYFTSFDRGRDRANGLYWSRYFKDSYEGSFGLSVRGQSVNGVPVSVSRNLVDIDVVRLTTTPFAINGQNVSSAAITRLTGHNSSFFEHSTPQAFYGANQWSAVRLLQNAAQNGQTIFHIDSTNIDSTLDRIPVPDAVASDIREQVARGRTVRIHSLPITPTNLPSQWGYIPEDLVTGEGAFRINAVLDGGDGDAEDAPVGAGPCPYCAQGGAAAGSTVDIANGTYYFVHTDMVLPARGVQVVFTRAYRSSNNTRATTLGPGWQHTYDERIENAPGGGLNYFDPIGLRSQFSTASDGSLLAPPGLHMTLARSTDGAYSLLMKDGAVHQFDQAGRLTAIRDTNGHALTLGRDANGRPTTLVDATNGPLLTFNYEQHGLLSSVQDVAGRSTSYQYDALGRLVSHTDVLSATKIYGYDLENQLVEKSDFRGNIWSIGYDVLGRWRKTIDPLGGTKTAVYDGHERKTVISDELGYPMLYGYDARGALTGTVDAEGNSTALTVDNDFNLTSETDARGGSTTSAFDSLGNLMSRTDALGNETHYTYGSFSRLLTTTDAVGNTTTNSYDENGNLTASTDAGGNTTTYVYSDGLPISITRPGSSTSNFSYDGSGNVSSVTDAEGGFTTIGHDTAGHITTWTNPNAQTTTFEVNAKGQIVAITDPSGARTTLTHDPDGNLSLTMDPTGAETSFMYDARSRRRSQTDAIGRVTAIDYDLAGNMVAITDPRGGTTRFSYDALRRRIGVTDALGGVTTFGYCAAVSSDKPCRTIDPSGVQQTIEYDALGRPVKATDGNGHATTTAYDGLGREVAKVDPNGNTTEYVYDAVGHISDVIDPLAGSVTNRYDGRGNRVALVDANAHETTFAYDKVNRLVSQTTPIGTTTTFQYDALGNRIAKLDGDNLTTEYHYDANRRVTSVRYDDGSTAEFTYDPGGKLLSEANADVARSMTYDSAGQLSTVFDAGLNRTIAFSYDGIGHRTGVKVLEDNVSTSYAWDLAGRLVSSTRFDGSRTSFGYDPAGRRTALAFPNGLAGSWSYDAAGQVLSVAWLGGGTGPSFIYSYDAVGNRLSKTFADGTAERYGYDKLNRLVSATYADGRQVTYDYDAAGNRLAMRENNNSNLLTTSYSYNAYNQLLSIDGPMGTSVFAYDQRGNQTSSGSAGGTSTMTYDARNRLVGWNASSGSAVTFGYDPEGLRVRIHEGSSDRRILLAKDEELAEYDDANVNTAHYEHDPSSIDLLLSQDVGGNAAYFEVDALRSVYGLVDGSGTEAARYSYDVFGTRSAASERIATPWSFTGRREDDTGLNYYRARYYDSRVGRFLSTDPANMRGGTNTYAYVGNNPATYVDPSGMLSSGEDTVTATEVSLIFKIAFAIEGSEIVRDAIELLLVVFSMDFGPGIDTGSIIDTDADVSECAEKKKEREKRCKEEYDFDRQKCADTIPENCPELRAICYASATSRYVACQRKQPQGPLYQPEPDEIWECIRGPLQ